jgi:Carboxypeptidase regulatory-like domain/TonB dependent receptor/TonB-dependent Receptor Plug Domain
MNAQISPRPIPLMMENRATSTFRIIVRITSLAIALCLSASLVHSQAETSEVLGTVRDPGGALVPGAAITLTNRDTGLSDKTTTDEQGNYNFLNVKVGDYKLAIERDGFSKYTSDVRVSVGVRQRVDAALNVGTVSEVIVVTESAIPLDTDSSEHGQLVSPTTVAELPLNGRNYADLALLSTNATKSPMAVSFSPSGTPREGAFNVNGMRSTYNSFLLDGADNNAYSTSNQGYSAQVAQPSPDAIAEFKVITSNYAAEYGRVGGAVVNAIMKSGTNAFHGTAYEFFRNTALNTKGFQFTPAPKTPLERNQFGMSFGGPVIKNKIFFFTDYEGYRQVQKYNNFDSIPTASDRAGILPVPVVNPLTGVVYAAGTQIPIAALNPFAATVLNNLPATNNGTTRASNLLEQLGVQDFSDKFDAKIDAQINEKMSGFVRFSQRIDHQFFAPDIPGPSGGGGNGVIHAVDQNAALGYTWNTGPKSLLEARFSFSHIIAGKKPPNLGGPSMLALYGIPGLPTTPDLTGGLNTQTVSGFSAFGRQTSNPQFQNPTSFGPKFNYSQIVGRHSLKMGYEYLVVRTEILDVNPLYGQDQYTGQFSKPTCGQLGLAAGCAIASDATSYNLADFIFGAPSIINLGSNAIVDLRQHLQSLFFQDDFRVTPKLTLNLGLRWDYATPLYERDNNYSNFDPTTNSMVKASAGSIFNRALVHPDYKDFGPRIGMAYSLFPKTVVRGGYGISYAYFNRVGSALEGINAPQELFGVLNQSIPAGGPVPATFLTTQNSFTTNIASPASFNPANSNVVYIPPDSRWPYIQTWFLGVQQQLTQSTVIELSYNGNHSLRLPILGDYNQAAPNAVGVALGVQARRPIPSFGPITWVDPVGNNHYNGISARLEHKFSAGLYFLNSFTYGSAVGDSEQALETYASYFQANPQNIRNLAAEQGPSSFDVKFNNVTSLVYQLPFGKGQRFASNWSSLADTAIGGWEITAVNVAHTGTPLNVFYGPTAAQDVTGLSNDYRGQAFQRPNVTGSAISQSVADMVNSFFAGYTFTTPPVDNPFGNLTRNAFRAPGFEQLDFSMNKNFQIREQMRLQFRSEFFNLMNHTNYGIPDTKTTDAAFGTIRTVYPGRQIQFALKLLF